MLSVFSIASVFVVTICIYLTVFGHNHVEKDSVIDGHINKINSDNIFKEVNSKNISPKIRRRRSVHNSRLHREVPSLVAGQKANSIKLDNLTSGMEHLIESTKAELIGYTEITKRLEAINKGLMSRLESLDSKLSKRLEKLDSEHVNRIEALDAGFVNRLKQLNPLFVSMFTLLMDVALSSSPRIDKHKEQAIDIANNFREHISTLSTKDNFDQHVSSVFRWYLNVSYFNLSCVEIRDAGFRISDVYPITINNKWLNVYCDQETDGGGWLVFQRRQDGSEDFYRNWTDYKNGFGKITGEFWLGNDYLNLLTKEEQELRIDLMDFDDNTAYAKYTTLTVGTESESYKLTVTGYSGTAGDSLEYHNGLGFSSSDEDNDGSSGSCAPTYKGGWWYKTCHKPIFDEWIIPSLSFGVVHFHF